MRNTTRKRIIFGLAALVAGSSALVAAPAAAQPRGCITDAELEAAVGQQLRSGAFAINTSTLREAPMCSGLTVAQAIQKLNQRLSPRPPAPAQPRPIPPAPSVAARPAAVSTGTAAELRAYAGEINSTRVRGRSFYQHPAVVAALRDAGVTPAVRKEIDRYAVVVPISRQGDVLIDTGCMPHACDVMHYTLFLNAASGRAALCLYNQGPAKWYVADRPAPLIVRGRDCNLQSLSQVPAEIGRAIATAANGPEVRQPLPGSAAPSPATIGEVIRLNQGGSFRGWSIIRTGCEAPAWRDCAIALRKGSIFWVIKTTPVSRAPNGSVLSERVTGLDRYVLARGETQDGWDCSVDGQYPMILAFVSANRHSVRAVYYSPSAQAYVAVTRSLGGRNWCNSAEDEIRD